MLWSAAMGLGGRHLRTLLMLFTAIAALSLVACGDDEGESGEAAEEVSAATEDASEQAEDVGFAAGNPDSAGFKVDPCTLLTEADVKALMGEPVNGDQRSKADPESGQPGQCFWELGGSVDLAAPNDTAFTVAVSAGDEAWYHNSRTLSEDDESYDEPSGIGDEAWAGDTRGGVLIGDAGLTVELGIAADPASQEVVLDALARVEANYSG